MQQALCTSFKQELLNAVHNFSTDTFKIALYTQASTIGPTTTVYTTTNEITATAYTAGGLTLTVSPTPTISGTSVYASFNPAVWPAGIISASGALIYNASKSNKAVMVLNFGAVKTNSSTAFTITFPAAAASTAIIRMP